MNLVFLVVLLPWLCVVFVLGFYCGRCVRLRKARKQARTKFLEQTTLLLLNAKGIIQGVAARLRKGPRQLTFAFSPADSIPVRSKRKRRVP